MRPIDGDHLRKWIISRGLEYSEKGSNLTAADILDQIDREPSVQPNVHGISRQAAIDAIDSIINEINVPLSIDEIVGVTRDKLEFGKEVLDIAKEDINELPSVQESRLIMTIKDKSAEETYNFLVWLLHDYGMQYTDTRTAVINWLKGGLSTCGEADI